jgi:hypothetical protein
MFPTSVNNDWIFPYDSTFLHLQPKLHDVSGPSFTMGTAVTIDTFTGFTDRTRYSPELRKSIIYTWECIGYDNRSYLKNFYSSVVAGQLIAFWAPLWVQSIALPNGVTANSQILDTYGIGFDTVYQNWIYQKYEYSPDAIMILLKNGYSYVRPVLACNVSHQIVIDAAIDIDIAAKDIFTVCRVLRWTFASGLTEKVVSNTNGALPITEISASLFQSSIEDTNKGVTYA